MLGLFAGDVVHSDLTLDLLPAAAGRQHDVRIDVKRVDSVDDLPTLDLERMLLDGFLGNMPWRFGELGDDGWGFQFGNGCCGRLSPDGTIIELFAERTVPDEWIAEAVTGWVLVYRLAIAGRSTFHGSAFSFDGESAVAVLGPSESGKSTLAAAAVSLGASVITDDVLAPRIEGGRVLLDSTGTAVKLRDVAQDLLPESRSASTFDGRRSVTVPVVGSSVILNRVYFIDPGNAVPIAALDAIDVATRLCANSKVGFWNSAEERGNDFEAACDIADLVSGFTIGRSTDGARPPIEHHLDIARAIRSQR